MLQHVKIENLDDYFKSLQDRREEGVYFYRINGYNEIIRAFIRRYYETAGKNGVIIEGKIKNPDEKNLAYYNEIMGSDFRMEAAFINTSLKKWLPRMNDQQRDMVAGSIYDCLEQLRKGGKNENMLKNAYIKFMCWLYYRFERVTQVLGSSNIPKILYEGEISNYELLLVKVLSGAGCDVVLLQYKGDAAYLKLDPKSESSDLLTLEGMKEFPAGFSLQSIRDAVKEDVDRRRLYSTPPEMENCTNTWGKGKVFEDIRTPASQRGSKLKLYYNCFCRVNGVEDKLTYANMLYDLNAELQAAKRRVVIIDGEIQAPTVEEIGDIQRKNGYQKKDQMLLDLAGNIKFTWNVEIRRQMAKSFVDVMLVESQKEGMNLNRLMNRGIYLLCWLKRYMMELFMDWKAPELACFIHFGPCKNENEALFLSFLARLPVDVLILVPDLNTKCILRDDLLYECNYANSLPLTRFPGKNTGMQVGTSAYHAEQELDQLMYADSGMYRNQQYARADVITLRTMYEEIAILWKAELKYRPNFETVDGVVRLPVIYAKVSGIKDSDVKAYWNGIRTLMQEEAMLITAAPLIAPGTPNPMKAYAVDFFKKGKLQRKLIKENKDYPYDVLREETQDHILDKLQLLIDRKIIKGTFENGTEYTIIATILNLDKEIVRALQKFDFTKKNPKLVWVLTGEQAISLEDSILIAFLNLAGFDIVFFVPTGYQSVEKYFNEKLFEEHQIGEYMYDLQIPNLKLPPEKPKKRFWDIFRKG